MKACKPVSDSGGLPITRRMACNTGWLGQLGLIYLVGAFETPVKTSTGGYSQPSIDAPKNYANRVYESFADAPVCAFCCSTRGDADEGFAAMIPIRALPERLETELGKYMDGEE